MNTKPVIGIVAILVMTALAGCVTNDRQDSNVNANEGANAPTSSGTNEQSSASVVENDDTADAVPTEPSLEAQLKAQLAASEGAVKELRASLQQTAEMSQDLESKLQKAREDLARYERLGPVPNNFGYQTWNLQQGYSTGWFNLSDPNQTSYSNTLGRSFSACYIQNDPSVVYAQDEVCTHRIQPGNFNNREGWNWEYVGVGVYGQKWVRFSLDDDGLFYLAQGANTNQCVSCG